MRCPVSNYIELKGRQARANILGSSSTIRKYRRSLLSTRASLTILNKTFEKRQGKREVEEADEADKVNVPPGRDQRKLRRLQSRFDWTGLGTPEAVSAVPIGKLRP